MLGSPASTTQEVSRVLPDRSFVPRRTFTRRMNPDVETKKNWWTRIGGELDRRWRTNGQVGDPDGFGTFLSATGPTRPQGVPQKAPEVLDGVLAACPPPLSGEPRRERPLRKRVERAVDALPDRRRAKRRATTRSHAGAGATARGTPRTRATTGSGRVGSFGGAGAGQAGSDRRGWTDVGPDHGRFLAGPVIPRVRHLRPAGRGPCGVVASAVPDPWSVQPGAGPARGRSARPGGRVIPDPPARAGTAVRRPGWSRSARPGWFRCGSSGRRSRHRSGRRRRREAGRHRRP